MARGHDVAQLTQIDGAMPRLTEIPDGCAFHPRCPRAFERCRGQRPELAETGKTSAACWLYGSDKGEVTAHG